MKKLSFLLRVGTYLFQIVTLRVSIENVFIGSLTALVIGIINPRLECCFGVLMFLPFVLLLLFLHVVIGALLLVGIWYSILLLGLVGISKHLLLFAHQLDLLYLLYEVVVCFLNLGVTQNILHEM